MLKTSKVDVRYKLSDSRKDRKFNNSYFWEYFGDKNENSFSYFSIFMKRSVLDVSFSLNILKINLKSMAMALNSKGN